MDRDDRPADGVHALVPRERMAPGVRKFRDMRARVPGAPLYQTEFGWYCKERWAAEEGFTEEMVAEFGFDPPARWAPGGLGWCEAAFCPAFEVKVLEDRGEHELVQDFAGRGVLYFKGRRDGFMPEYVTHPVTDWPTWEQDVKWRLDPNAPGRFDGAAATLAEGRAQAGQGMWIFQGLVGGYMYLRSLFGPEQIMYAWYDQPDLVEDCMRTWFELADAVIARHQQELTFDEIFFCEDICYNHGLLCSPDTMKRFLLPYYQQLVTNMKRRQLDPDRPLCVQVDTDGDCRPSIEVYREAIGLDVMSPFEVAAGCDVVEIGKQYPWLAMSGGIDKRVLASTTDAIDRMVERILPTMRDRGGYYPTCDHGVPEEVPLANYRHYRRRCLELGG